jgi:hypothetical protein
MRAPRAGRTDAPRTSHTGAEPRTRRAARREQGSSRATRRGATPRAHLAGHAARRQRGHAGWDTITGPRHAGGRAAADAHATRDDRGPSTSRMPWPRCACRRRAREGPRARAGQWSRQTGVGASRARWLSSRPRAMGSAGPKRAAQGKGAGEEAGTRARGPKSGTRHARPRRRSRARRARGHGPRAMDALGRAPGRIAPHREHAGSRAKTPRKGGEREGGLPQRPPASSAVSSNSAIRFLPARC